MKKVFLIFLVFIVLIPCLAQEPDSVTVSGEFIQKLYHKVKELERSDSLKTEKVKIQEEIIINQDYNIKELKHIVRLDSMEIELYKEQINLTKPKWYDNPKFNFWLGFVFSGAMIYTTSEIIGNVN